MSDSQTSGQVNVLQIKGGSNSMHAVNGSRIDVRFERGKFNLEPKMSSWVERTLSKVVEAEDGQKLITRNIWWTWHRLGHFQKTEGEILQ
ncbi:hypothetical protein CEXT_431651 [Caerostris extrusa]|uniref:Uncharacterized protein n=1 Tax=Caerostris extrusa TaxID=172846 RepID=A0AAV4VIH5_CAEEX|nr:hypothetical protein CEXT_431651 [Caerostris extrusa]